MPKLRLFCTALCASLVLISAPSLTLAQQDSSATEDAVLVDTDLALEVAPIVADPLEATPAIVPTPTPSPLSAAVVADQAAASLVQVVAPGGATGTGIKVSAGILTNEHVVRGADWVQITTVGGRKGSAKVVNTDGGADLALITPDLDLPSLEIEPSRQQPLGTDLLVLGYPRPDEINGSPTLTRGLLSAWRSDDAGHLYVQTDAAANPGNSGSPLLNLQAKIVGLIAFKIIDSQGLNFAISSETIQTFLALPFAIRPAVPAPTATPLPRSAAPTPTATPLPRPATPTPVPTPAGPSPALASACFQFAFQTGVQGASTGASIDYGQFVDAVRNGCVQAGLDHGVLGVQCWEFAVNQAMNMAARGVNSGGSFEPLYRSCVGR